MAQPADGTPDAPDAPEAPDTPEPSATEGDKGYNYELTPQQQAEIEKMINEYNEGGLTPEEHSKIAEKRLEFQAENNNGKPPPSTEAPAANVGGMGGQPGPAPA